MQSKLTIKLEQEIIARGKAHAEQQGISLSKLIENYLRLVTQVEQPDQLKYSPVIQELSGIISLESDLEQEQEAYMEYLLRKHREDHG